MENKNQYENEMNVPSEEKLESMVNLFQFAMNEAEQKFLLLYFLAQSIETFGQDDVRAKVEVLIADGVGDCPDNCPICNPDKQMMSEEAMMNLWESIRGNGVSAKGEGDDEDEGWSEVIH